MLSCLAAASFIAVHSLILALYSFVLSAAAVCSKAAAISLPMIVLLLYWLSAIPRICRVGLLQYCFTASMVLFSCRMPCRLNISVFEGIIHPLAAVRALIVRMPRLGGVSIMIASYCLSMGFNASFNRYSFPSMVRLISAEARSGLLATIWPRSVRWIASTKFARCVSTSQAVGTLIPE